MKAGTVHGSLALLLAPDERVAVLVPGHLLTLAERVHGFAARRGESRHVSGVRRGV